MSSFALPNPKKRDLTRRRTWLAFPLPRGFASDYGSQRARMTHRGPDYIATCGDTTHKRGNNKHGVQWNGNGAILPCVVPPPVGQEVPG